MVMPMNGSKAWIAPPNKTQSIYLRRIGLALTFIEQHIDQTIQLDDVARASHFSAYHFHRIFHAIVGETVNDYVSRKRMEKAVRRLMHTPELSITEVAEAGGFSSSANFAKSFKLYFGVSPSELRKYSPTKPGAEDISKIGKIYRKYGKAFKPEHLYSQFVTNSGVFDPDKLEDMLMQVKVEDVQEKALAYLSSPRGYELHSIYATWDKVNHWGEARGIKKTDQMKFGICHDNPVLTPEDKCHYDAAIVIDKDTEVKAPFIRGVFPLGKYAIAYYKDTAEKISPFMTEFCGQWMSTSGYEPDDYPSLFHYLNDSREEGVVEMNVYIKLKALDLK